MDNIVKSICSIVVSLVSTQFVFSQPPGSATLNRLEITYFYTSVDTESGDDEYRFKLSLDGLDQGCYQINGASGGHDVSFPLTFDPYIPNIALPSTLTTELWENDDAPECNYNNDDDDRCGPVDNYLTFGDYEPGMTHNTFITPCPKYQLLYTFSYSVPQPSNIAMTEPGIQICEASPYITLAASSFINPAFIFRAAFVWEYWSTASPGWQLAGITSVSTNGGEFSFSNIRSFPGIAGITSNTDVFFRVRTRYLTHDGIFYYSNYSTTGDFVQLSPLPPTVNSVSPGASCPNQNTGAITVDVTGFGEYLYVLRTGENSQPCNPELNDCGGSQSGRVFSNTFNITGVAPGRYTLIVANRGASNGVCWNYSYLDVGEIPELQANVPDIVHVSCNGLADGNVMLTSSGGVTPWEYSLNKTGFSQENTTGDFNSLPAGNYTAAITDGCSQLVTIPVAINEPRKTEASVSLSNPFCNNPPDGSATVNVSAGEGSYSYRLLKNNQVVEELDNDATTSWQVDNLSGGSYRIEVRDAQRLQCEGFTESVGLVEAPEFEIEPGNITTQNLTCFESGNGIIHLQQADESGDFLYVLSDQNGIQVSSSPVPQFPSLSADLYSLAMIRNRQDCLDRFDHPLSIAVTQPDEIGIILNKQNISCHGLDDGRIASTVNGSTPTDQYLWETLIGTSWVSLSSMSSSLEDLGSGSYRLRLNNGNGCAAVSEETVIEEPGVMAITSVNVKEIVCFGEPGEIEANVEGGVTPYRYIYFSSGDTIESSSQNVQIDQGQYMLRVSDVNGCTVDYATTLTVTSPESPLSITYTLSDFNNYNISCAGASNGYVQIAASGGSASGYRYALDENPYKQNGKIENIPAGAHNISAKDSRGCVVTNAITMTEPASQLTIVQSEKKDVKCYGDQNGLLSIVAAGGVEPYSYRLFGNLTQSTGTFSDLPPGEYTITISDKNGCTDTYWNKIEILSAPMTVITQKNNVSCHNGSDGFVESEVSGGTAPIQYQWLNSTEHSSSLANLRAGEYTIEVTDGLGCKRQHTVTIHQPEELTLSAVAIPVCVGKANGELRLIPSGGTSPYIFSINEGLEYQSTSLFTEVAAGTYALRVRDAHQCEASGQTELTVRHDKPEPDFIVSTKQNAQDTLVIREISVPKPDSIEWSFDPVIIVLNKDPWSPEILIKEPGIYPISLKGFFGGCEYVHNTTLTISPYDPERHNGPPVPGNAIKGMTVNPNPSAGIFNVTIELSTKQHLAVRVIDVLGTIRFQESWEQTLGVNKEIDLTASAVKSGIYIVQAISDTDVREVRIIIDR